MSPVYLILFWHQTNQVETALPHYSVNLHPPLTNSHLNLFLLFFVNCLNDFQWSHSVDSLRTVSLFLSFPVLSFHNETLSHVKKN